ncbi:MAG: cytochrome c3 family protein [Bacteroidales bacterium]|nr:cytochrome c3 family protein [Bacteroidales bacterium]
MKKIRKFNIPYTFISALLGFFLLNNSFVFSQETEDQLASPKGIENSYYAEENESCLKCHGEKIYILQDTIMGLEKKASMCIDNRIDRDAFYNSVHYSFSCLDCHSYDYLTFPHALELRFEEHLNCLDCHGYDETYAKYKFEEIEEECMKSVHYQATNGSFTCWDCHDPHSNKLISRGSTNIPQVVLQTNSHCLECHGSIEAFELLSDKDLGNIVPKHQWLPNQELHFGAVRCIECHTEINDSLMVAHNILPAKDAVRNCVSCHSQNSILMGSLYKYQSKETRLESGFLNGAIINNNSYVIGANRSKFLNIISLLVFGLAFIVMSVHVTFRIIHRKN